jgi:hypothetical protein
MKGEALRYVATLDIKQAVSGREEEVLDHLGIDHRASRRNRHITCPYPEHGGMGDWRWDERKRLARCTCIKGGDSIFNVVMKCEGLPDFEAAKVRTAEILGRHDLIKTKGTGGQSTKPDALLRPPPDKRDDRLVGSYLAHRLDVDPAAAPLPITPIAGWKALGYYDPPKSDRGKPEKVGDFPCAVFGTVAADGKTHAHRIYLAPGGRGKADLGLRDDGSPRDPKKSARTIEGDNISGRSVLWGDPKVAPWIIVTEGIETAAAVALSFKVEIGRQELAVAAAVSATGVEAFLPWPATKRVTIAADRDEKPSFAKEPSRRGERAARQSLGVPDDKTRQKGRVESHISKWEMWEMWEIAGRSRTCISHTPLQEVGHVGNAEADSKGGPVASAWWWGLRRLTPHAAPCPGIRDRRRMTVTLDPSSGQYRDCKMREPKGFVSYY